MKTKTHIRIFVESKLFKVMIVIITIISISGIIIIPSLLTATPDWAAISFNRDATSGTREAFADKILDTDPDTFSPGKNVREVKNNESMIKSVIKNKHSIGYVSFGTVAYFDLEDEGMSHIKEKYEDSPIQYATINGVNPQLDPNTHELNNYNAKRNFNSFFRVEKNSNEAKFLDSSWGTTFDNPNDLTTFDNDIKGSYLFYSWMNYSNEAADLLLKESEVPSSTKRIDFTDDLVNDYIDDVELNVDERIKISVVGSSSARKVLDLLSTEVEGESFKYIAEENWGLSNVEFEKATNGSGDAFKESIAGTTDPYIGLQSREPKEGELLSWGWNYEDVNTPYIPFAIDALLVIYNTKGLDDDANIHRNINGSDEIYKLYSDNDWVRFDDVLEMPIKESVS